MLALTVIAAILTAVPFEERCGVVCDDASTLEFETYYDDEGREVFLQLLVWEATAEGEEIRSWRLWKTDQRPMRNSDGTYTLIWQDGEAMRKVAAKNFRETHRQTDTELRRRSVLEKHLRRPLTPYHDEPSPADLSTESP